MMDDLEQKIGEVLQDPEQMQKIMEMAQSLGLRPDAAPTEMPEKSGKELALLQALKPFLSPRRQRKLERAMQMTKLSELARLAMEQAENETE